MLNLQELERLFATTRRWWLNTDALACQVQTDGRLHTVHVPAATLSVVHPRMWEALQVALTDYIVTRGLSAEFAELPGDTLLGQYTLLQYPERKLSGHQTSTHVAKLTSVRWGGNQDSWVSFGFFASTFAVSATEDEPPLEYVLGTHINGAMVQPDWLDQHYPGWRERYLAAAALGYTEEELADVVQVGSAITTTAVLPLPVGGLVTD